MNKRQLESILGFSVHSEEVKPIGDRPGYTKVIIEMSNHSSIIPGNKQHLEMWKLLLSCEKVDNNG